MIVIDFIVDFLTSELGAGLLFFSSPLIVLIICTLCMGEDEGMKKNEVGEE